MTNTIKRHLTKHPAMSNRRIAHLVCCTVKEVREMRYDMLASGELERLRPEDVVDWPEE